MLTPPFPLCSCNKTYVCVGVPTCEIIVCTAQVTNRYIRGNDSNNSETIIHRYHYNELCLWGFFNVPNPILKNAFLCHLIDAHRCTAGHVWYLFTHRNPIFYILLNVWLFYFALVQKTICLFLFSKRTHLINICASIVQQKKIAICIGTFTKISGDSERVQKAGQGQQFPPL